MTLRRRIWELFAAFFKIGMFTFGGGYAMISLIDEEVSRRRGWITPEELTEVIAIAESTPGPIAINCATYVGYLQAGTAGSVAATLGVVLPSFMIIYCISLFLERFMALAIIANAFKGIQVAVAALILRAGIRLIKRMPHNAPAVIACIAAAGAVMLINLTGWRFSTIWLILMGAASGILLSRGGVAK